MEKLKKSTAKEYNLIWLADDGEQVRLGSVITANPTEALFNAVCCMIVTASYWFKVTKEFNIKKAIKRGKTEREHYFINVGEQYLSLMEANYKY